MGTDNSAFQLGRELDAARALRQQFADAFRDDPDIFIDMAEGSTSVFEMIEAVLCSLQDDIGMIEGTKVVKARLDERKRRFERRVELKRAMVLTALTDLGVKSREFAIASIGFKNIKPAPVVKEEAELPSDYFTKPKPPDPQPDKQKIAEHYRERAKALEAAAKIEDVDERAAAIARADEEYPALPGVQLDNGSNQLSISWK